MSAPLFNKNGPLYAVTEQKIDNLRETLEREKLTPWLLFNSRGFEGTDFYGKTVCQQGIPYGEHQWNVFLYFVKPFLKDAIVKTLDKTLETCCARGWTPEEPYIKETAMLLHGHLIDPIYSYMAEIDQRIRGKGDPKSVRRKDVTDEITEMVKFLDDCKDKMIQGVKEQNELSNKAESSIETTSETARLEGNPMRDQVFIGYSHKDDKRWLKDLQTHLKPCIRNGSVTAWSDKQIAPGSKWFPEIKAALASTKVAVLLVTPNFLASDFIHEHELTPLLKEAEKGDVRIIWISVRACAYKETPLKDYQAANDLDKPLASMKADRDKAWVRICEEIKKAVSSPLA
jgi:hypothetical protein